MPSDSSISVHFEDNKIVPNDLIRKVFASIWRLMTLGILLACGMTYWALTSPIFRNAEGFVSSLICLPISASIALLVLSFTVNTTLFRSGFWFALALLGQGVVLQMVYAGRLLHYQHYQPPSELFSGFGIVLLLFLGLQVLLVIVGFRKYWSTVRSWLLKNFRVWQIGLISLIFIFSSATVSESISFFIFELGFATIVQLVNLGNIVLAVWELSDDALMRIKSGIDKIFYRNEQSAPDIKRGGLDRFAAIAAVWVILVSAFLNVASYQRHPHVADEVAYLYHAEFFAQGILTSPSPPDMDAFELYLMQFDGTRWYPSTPPGWPAVLSIGVLLNAPWLVNPVLGGINILLTYLLLQMLYSRRLARISVFLLCLSPWFIFMAMNFMTHTLMLTCALGATLGIFWARQSDSVYGMLGAGFALGMLSLIRPLEGLLMAVLLGLLLISLYGRRIRVRLFVVLIVMTGIVAGLILPYNKYLTGKVTTFPINQYTDQFFGPNSNSFGFGPDRGMGWAIDPYPGHSPLDAIINANLNTYASNVELFGWSVGSLLLASIFVFSGHYKSSDLLMLALIFAIFAMYFFYYFSGGPDFGARYWYLMIVPLVTLSVRGIQVLEKKLTISKPGHSAVMTRVMIGVLFLSLISLVNFFPWRAIDKYFHYLDMRPDVHDLAKKFDFQKSLVFIRGDQLPDYASAAAYNPVDLSSDQPIYVWQRDPKSLTNVVSAYPSRSVWFVDGPSISGRGFEMIAGPLSSSTVLSPNFLP